MSAAEEIYAFLQRLGVIYREAAHAPANTMRECAKTDAELGALTPKNLFLCTRNQKRFFLCLTRPEASFHTADISKQAGSARLSFASEAQLTARLRCRAGSASPLGLIFPEAAGVGLIVDRALRDAPALGFHPCDNTRTLAVAGADFFERFLPAVGVDPVFVEIHDFLPPRESASP